jgi:polysaccharide biosynthesis/export protein
MANMLNNCKIVSLFLLLTLFFSCKTRKDLLYLQDIKDKEVLNVPGPSPEYRIRTDDNIYVNIQTVNSAINQLFNSAQNSVVPVGSVSSTANQTINGYIVDSSGTITIPGLGTVPVAGKTALEAQTIIQEKANVYLKDASVQVKILSFKVTLLGELRNPGVFYNYNNSMTVIDAIGMAGGMTENAQISQLLIVRRTPTGSKSYRIDLSEKKMLSSEAYYLQPNDVIYVNADKMKNIRLTSNTYTFLLTGITTIMVMLQYFRN